jgi:ribosomal protein S18 acetylase RimI-like enzyme
MTPPLSFTTHQMTGADLHEVLALWRSSEGIGLSPDADSKLELRAFLERNPGLSYVARAGDRLVGAVLCGHDGRRGYLYHLAVAPGARRGGIGRTLVQCSLDELKRLGIHKCHLFVFADNRAGIEFWRKIGWSDRADLKIMSKLVDGET